MVPRHVGAPANLVGARLRLDIDTRSDEIWHVDGGLDGIE